MVLLLTGPVSLTPISRLVYTPGQFRMLSSASGKRLEQHREEIMMNQGQKWIAIAATAGIFAVGAAIRTSIASGQAGTATGPAFTPQSQPVAAGEFEAKKLLILMDADKSGTVSKKEYMDFMEAEFDRLDTNKDGVLDVKELEQSQLTQTHRGGGHR